MKITKKIAFFIAILTFFNQSSSDALADEDNAAIKPQPRYHWTKKFTWYYTDYKEPSWLSINGLELFKKAALAWDKCGVEIEFQEIIHSPALEKNNLNAMGWIENPSQSLRGITLRLPDKESYPKALHEADVGINSLNAQIKENPRLLQKVITHEFGHALGLIHSTSCDDVMSSAAQCKGLAANPPPITPTENDLRQCAELYIKDVIIN